MAMASPAATAGAADAAAAAAAGCEAAGLAAAKFQLGAAGLLHALTAYASWPVAAMMRRVRSMSSLSAWSGTPRPGHHPRAVRSILGRSSW